MPALCGDCLGYTNVFADAAESFTMVLDQYQFGQTAHSVFPMLLEDYDKLYDILGFMTSLKRH